MKKIFLLFITGILFLFSFSADAQTTQSSSWSVNQSLPAYSLDKNNGDRTMVLDIRFDKTFTEKPQVFLSVTQIDSDKESNTRYNAEAISISCEGFTLVVHTWADSKIYSISGYWIAKTQ